MATKTTSTAAAGGTFSLGDMTVNRMGFGAMRITGDGIWGEPKNPEEAKVLRRAVEIGVNFIDTADSYGPEVSERIIAEALHPYPGGLVIATKAGQNHATGPEQMAAGRKAGIFAAVFGDEFAAVETGTHRIRTGLHRIDPKVPAEEQFGESEEECRTKERSGRLDCLR